MIASLASINSPAYMGPLSSRVSGSDFSVFTGIAVGGFTYWLLARRSVPAEEGIASDPAPVATRPVPLAHDDG